MEQFYSKQSLTCPIEMVRAIAGYGCSSAIAVSGIMVGQ
jgi:hypothetical protein